MSSPRPSFFLYLFIFKIFLLYYNRVNFGLTCEVRAMFKFEVRSFANGKQESAPLQLFETESKARNYISSVVQRMREEISSNLTESFRSEFLRSHKLIPDPDMCALNFKYTVDNKNFVHRWEIHELKGN